MKRFTLLLFWALWLPLNSFADDPPKQPSATDAKPPESPPAKAPESPPAKPIEGHEAHAAGAPVDAKTYIIGAEDVLYIRVWDSAQVSGPVSVRPDGIISLPLIGEVHAAGLTPEKLGASITESLTKYMTHPDVSVSVTSINSKKYFIIGEVSRTGSFPLLIPTTVLEALVNAGGFRDFAKKSRILIIRGPKRFTFNYNDVIRGKHTEQNILIEPGDQIVVP